MKEWYLYKTIIKLRLRDYKAIGTMIIFPIILTTIFIQVFNNLESSEGVARIEAFYQAIGQLGAPYTLEVIPVESIPMWMTIGVTMIVFTSLLGGQYAITQITGLRKPVGVRMLHLALDKKRVYMVYGLANVSLLFGQLFLISMIYQFVFKINLWNRIDLLVIILFLMSVLSIAIGMIIGLWCTDEGMASGILSGFVSIVCMLSGGLMPNVDMPIAKFNPFSYIIDALIQIVREGKVEGFVSLCLGLSMAIGVLSLIGYLKMRKEGI